MRSSFQLGQELLTRLRCQPTAHDQARRTLSLSSELLQGYPSTLSRALEEPRDVVVECESGSHASRLGSLMR